MRRRVSCLVPSTLCLALACGLGEWACAGDQEVKLVWEKDFGLPVWDFAVARRTGGGSYLKWVLTESDLGDSVNVSFFNEEMELTKKLELPSMSQAHFSENGEYLGIFTPQAFPEKEGFITAKLAICDSHGNELWSVDSIWMPYEIRILGNADRVACFYVSEIGGMLFADSTGYISALFDPLTGDSLSGDSIWDACPFLFSSASDDGELLVVNAASDDQPSTVFLFTKNRAELWRKQLPEQAAAETHVSASGLVVASAFTGGVSYNAYLLDGPGAPLEIHSLEGWAPVRLFHDGALLAGAFGPHCLTAFATDTGDTVWRFEDPDSTASFTSLDLSDTIPFRVLAGATTDDTTGALTPNTQLPRYLYLLGPQAELLWKQEFSGAGYPNFNGPLPKFGTSDGREFYVGNRNTVYKYVAQ